MTHRPLLRTLTGFLALSTGLGLSTPYDLSGQEGSSPPTITSMKVDRFSFHPPDWTSLQGPARPGEYVGAVGTRAAI